MSLKLLSEIKSGHHKPFLCLEVNPPRGTDFEHIFKRLDNNVEGIDFFNITDSALARMKMAPIPFASMLKQRYGIEPLVNLSCRDRNLIAIQGDLLAAWAMGIRSPVALTGDAVTVGDSPNRKGVFEVNSVGLLGVIEKLNSGEDLAGNKLQGSPKFVPGVVANPNAKNVAAEVRRLVRKKEAGACYALTQPVFDPVVAEEFLARAGECGLPIFLGFLPLKKGASALGIANIPGIRLPEDMLKYAGKDPGRDMTDYSFKRCLEIAQASLGKVCGFHVISGATPRLALKLAGELKSFISEKS
ncbi:MAG: hypothetical protein D6719_02850 [Candidatus Dadabacteria bacterium]|nr:MAG: hypothetical protein D6719_02850 [Candidatus Dadabacteria bacterium]